MSLAAPFPYVPHSGIEVRPDGSIWRIVSHGKPCTPRRIDLSDRAKGYRNVVLPIDGRWRTLKAHRLVWEWHHGPIPDGLQVNHINLDKSDNRVANLELVTPAGNIRHSYANGRTRPWSRATSWRGKPRLTKEAMADMRAMRHAGSTLAEVAAMAGCSVTHAQRIVSGKEV